MQSHGVLSKPNSVKCLAAAGLQLSESGRRASRCSLEFPLCTCSSSTTSTTTLGFKSSSLHSNFVPRNPQWRAQSLSGVGSRVKRAVETSPRAVVATATDVAEVGPFLRPFLGVCVERWCCRRKSNHWSGRVKSASISEPWEIRGSEGRERERKRDGEMYGDKWMISTTRAQDHHVIVSPGCVCNSRPLVHSHRNIRICQNVSISEPWKIRGSEGGR